MEKGTVKKKTNRKILHSRKWEAYEILVVWNAVIPYVFGLPVISWSKAWCLMLLANMLIKASSFSVKD